MANYTTCSITVTSYAPYVKDATPYTINITANTGYTITYASLTIGTTSVSREDAGTLSITPSSSGNAYPHVSIMASYNGSSRSEKIDLDPIEVVKGYVNVLAVTSARINTSGIATESGTNVCLKALISYAKMTGHYLTKPVVKVNGTQTNNVTWYTTWTATGGFSNAVNWTNYTPNSPITLYGKVTDTFSDSTNYTISIIATTNFLESSEKSTIVPQPFRLLSGRAGGKGLGVGMKPTSDAFWIGIGTEIAARKNINFNLDSSDQTDSAMSSALNNVGLGTRLKQILTYLVNATKADYVTSQGTESGGAVDGSSSLTWTYRTWNSGVAECWGVATQTVTSWKTWGSYYYYGDPYTAYYYPHGLFKSGTYPVVTATGGTTSTVADVVGVGVGGTSTNVGNYEHTPSLFVTRPTSGANGSYKIFIHAIGVWK